MKKALLVLLTLESSHGFLSQYSPPATVTTTTSTSLFAKRNKKNFVTVKQLMEEARKDAARAQSEKTEKKKGRRTRQRVGAPKQKYLYAAQRKALERSGVVIEKDLKSGDEDEGEEEGGGIQVVTKQKTNLNKNNPITIARNLGLNPASQACEASFAVVETNIADGEDGSFNRVTTAENPRIIGQLQVGGDDDGGISGMYAYVIEKPAGWAILEGTKKKKKAPAAKADAKSEKKEPPLKSKPKSEKGGKRGNLVRTKYYDEERDVIDVMEYDTR